MRDRGLPLWLISWKISGLKSLRQSFKAVFLFFYLFSPSFTSLGLTHHQPTNPLFFSLRHVVQVVVVVTDPALKPVVARLFCISSHFFPLKLLWLGAIETLLAFPFADDAAEPPGMTRLPLDLFVGTSAQHGFVPSQKLVDVITNCDFIN